MADVQETGAQETGQPVKKPLKAMGFKFGVGKKAPPNLVEVAPAKADELGAVPMPPVKAVAPAAVKSMFGKVGAPAAKSVAVAKAVPVKKVEVPSTKPKVIVAPAAPVAAAPAVEADTAAPLPELADVLLAQQEEGEAAAPGAPTPSPFQGDLKEMAELILNEERKDLYDTAVPDAYVPQTRRGFSDFIKTTYSPFQLPEGPIQTGEGEKYYPYQKFVRDYLRKESPYRGVLVYHGLGSGKTCTSIATAEALYASDKRRVIVMTPASLRKNFQSEVSFCGFRHFQYNNYWVQLDPAEPTTTLFASQVLGMSAADIKAARAIWVPDFRRPQTESNFATLPPESRDEIRKQIQRQLEYYPTTNPKGRMQFINYNGITNEKLLRMSCIRAKDGSGPFDNSVIVIDEVHNLIRMMQASIEPYLRASMEAQGIVKQAADPKKARHAGRKRVVPAEPITYESWKPSLCPSPEGFQMKQVVGADGKITMVRPALPKLYTRAYMLFRLITSAKNVKIVALSGTPIINFPEEIGILANLLHGFTTVVTGSVRQTGAAAKRIMEETAHAHPFVDFVEARQEAGVAGAGSYTVTMSLLPEGIRKVANDVGVERIPPEEERPDVPAILASIQEAFAQAGVPFTGGNLTPVSEELLPMFHDEFKAAFLEGDFGERLRKDRVSVLITRLTGLVSFYKGSNQELMPRIKTDEIVRVPFSLYAQKAYSVRRGQEIEKESKKEDKDISNVWKKIYGMSDTKASSNYKTGSRQACNFAFPPIVARPVPANKKQAQEEAEAGVVDDERNMLFEYAVLDDETVAAAEANAAVAGPAPLVPEGGEEDLDTGAVAADAMAEDAAILKAIGEGVEDEGAMEGGAEEEEDTLDKNINTEEEEEHDQEEEGDEIEGELSMEGGAGNGEEASGAAGAPAPAPAKKTLALLREEKRLKEVMAARAAGTGPPEAECLDGKPKPGEDYIKGTCERAKECLRTTARKHMLLTNKEDGLPVTSPKMAAILQRVLDTPGSSLVYSAFLTLEGIGIFTVAMDVNGFSPIRIIERPLPGGGYGIDFDDESKASIMKGPGHNRYMLFTGGEKAEIRRMGLNLFNAKFDQLPAALANMLRVYGFTDNKRGELCRVFCITSAGAEGLSLKNVRAVHIMEPYWNYVRMRQVKGRAVRIGSHLELPEADRDVSIYTYVSVFPEQAQRAHAGDFRIDADILQRDRLEDVETIRELGFPLAPGQKSYVVTTDELIYAIMERKRKIFDTMESLLKAAAVDCELNYKQNRDGSFVCLPLKGKVGDFLYHPVLARDLAEGARFKAPAFLDKVVPAAPAPVAAPVPATAPVAALPKAMPRRPATKAPIQATAENAKRYVMERLKAHVIDFYEEVLPKEQLDAQLEKVDGLVEKYKGAIWQVMRRKYPEEVVAKHEAEWKAGAEVRGNVTIQKNARMFAPEVVAETEEAAPYKPIVAPLPPAVAAPSAPVAATPAAAAVVPGIPVPGIPVVKKLFGPRKIIYRMEVATDATGARVFNMYEDATNKFAGTAAYQDGKPAKPVRAVPGWTF